MKTLRYLLIAVTVLSVLSLSAQTHQYVTHSHEQATYTGVHVNPQMPTATMDWHSDYMTSGSTLPQAALEGPTTTYDEGTSSHKGGLRRAGGGQTGGGPDDREDPYGDPIGDAAIPLALLACAYLIIRVRRAKGDRTA